MNTQSRLLHIPGIRQDGRRHESISIDDLAHTLRTHFRVPTAGPGGALRSTRDWRLVVPTEAVHGPPVAERIRAVAELCRLRKAEEPLIFQAPPGESGEAAMDLWIENHAQVLAERQQTLLLLGDAAELPWLLQQKLGLSHAVGRLHFEDADAYARYAARVCMPPPEKINPRAVLFGTDTDELTRWGRSLVVEPMVGRLGRHLREEDIQLLVGDDATTTNLAPALETAHLLFALSHGGVGSYDGDPWWGALMGQENAETGDALWAPHIPKRGAIAEGGAVVMFSCFGLGARRDDTMPGFLPDWATGEFNRTHDGVAPMPSAMLDHPRGPLGVVGHVGQAYLWGVYSGLTGAPVSGNSAGLRPIQSLMGELAQGASFGTAMWPLRNLVTKRLDELRKYWQQPTTAGLGSPEDNYELVERWVTWNDAFAWALMGDPAACPVWGVSR